MNEPRRYDFVMQVIYEKVANMIEVGIHPNEIGEEIRKTCRLELRLFDIDKDMLIKFCITLAEMAWYMHYRNMDFERITTEKEKAWKTLS